MFYRIAELATQEREWFREANEKLKFANSRLEARNETLQKALDDALKETRK